MSTAEITEAAKVLSTAAEAANVTKTLAAEALAAAKTAQVPHTSEAAVHAHAA